MANLLFYIVGIGAVASAIGVVLARNPILSVLSLLASFFCLATVYLLAGFQFMAAAQLLVYAGAIMVLFLFVIMLLNLGDPEVQEGIQEDALTGRRLAWPMGIAGTLLLLGMIAVKQQDLPEAVATGEGVESMAGIAALIFSKYTLPFEAAGVLLLAATVAVLVLAKRERPTPPAARGEEAPETVVKPAPEPAPAAQPRLPEPAPVHASAAPAGGAK